MNQNLSNTDISAVSMYNVLILLSGLKYLHTLSCLAEKLNEFFVNAKLVDLVPLKVKSHVMKSGLQRLAGILVCYLVSSVSMGLLTHLLLEDIEIEQGIDLKVSR